MIRKMIYTLLTIVALFAVWQGYELWMAAGRLPRGERLERCRRSPQWRDGAFANVHETPTLTSDKSTLAALWEFLTFRAENLAPKSDVPTVKTDLRALPRTEEVVVWLGHSSVYIQTGGVRFLFDPVLTNRLPVWWFMRPFRGTETYTPDDMPDIDYLVITHDHWDHLDWRTVRALKDRVQHVVCALGIGEHFEYWGYDPERIHDMDWNDSIVIEDGKLNLRCLPTRHFSGRLLTRGKSLWASFLIDVNTDRSDSTATGPRRIFVSGDGGYDERFRQFGQQYPDIDLAIMENGQYNEGWRHIHTLPSELPTAISELGARRVLTYHNSKYALARHAWTEPLDSILLHAQGQPWQLLTPRIGDPVRLDEEQHFAKWW